VLTFDRRAIARSNQLAAGLVAAPTVENVLFALPPKAVIAAIQTTTIRASITAYSTAVGPSSAFRNLTSEREIVVIGVSFLVKMLKESCRS